MPSSLKARAVYLAATLVIVGVGLTLRLVPLGLPMGIVKYGGSALWAAMVYGSVAACLPGRRGWILIVAGAIAVAVELFRLVHTPWLDGFRLTLAGALLLGRIFSVWNLVAYAAGLVAAALVDRWAGPARRRQDRQFGPSEPVSGLSSGEQAVPRGPAPARIRAADGDR